MTTRLDHPLTLEDPQSAPDGAGGFTRLWVPMGTLWASLNSGPGRERAGGAGAVSEVAYEITVRAAPMGDPARPTPSQRFRLGARVFRIEAVSEADPAGRYLSCRCVSEVAT